MIKISNLPNEEREYLRVSDLDNLFSIKKDSRGNYVYNLNETVYINVSDDQLMEYIPTCNCYWPLISYNIYGTTRLAWLLMKVNKVGPKNLFKRIRAGQAVKYLNKDYVQSILHSINNYF